MQLVIVSGLSGAGKTVALRQFEDLGWYCIDNLPLALVQPLVARALSHPEPRFEHVAIGIDARATVAEIQEFPQIADTLRNQGVMARVLFLTANEHAILARFNDTRRRHPLTSAEVTLRDAINRERALLQPIAKAADETLDTSDMNQHDLRFAVHAQLPGEDDTRLALTFLSFGYKHGLPDGVDFIFDARCL
ncbi:MAG: RNase adaptor protein RapZ, partial [Sinobacteraceae bacterium]|nr:RNase adaptor protein RapZ [Nevskiaceae bacterium]